MDAFGMGLPGVQTAPQTSIVDGLTGFQTERLPDGSVRSVQTIGGMTEAEAQAIRDSLERTQNMTTDEAADAAMEELEAEIQQQSSVDPNLFGVSRVQSRSITPDLRQAATVPAGQFFSENPEALAAIDSDAVRSAVMDPGTRQGFFVDDVTGEISRELPGGSGIRAVVGQIPGMEAPVDFSLPSLSDLTEGIAGIGSAIRGLGSNPFRAEAERRRTTSGNVFRPST
tara:strand:- start:543 stop:1223 length:681 start_codon:yes stop_codon:yes gene_type:complete